MSLDEGIPHKIQAHLTAGGSLNEDLMMEHGLLNRVLLIFENLIEKIGNGQKIDLSLIKFSLEIVRKFFQDHHEKTEEKYIFPLLLETPYSSDVLELINQHNKGRIIVDDLFQDLLKEDLGVISLKVRSLIDMYRIHEARENTVIFHAFRKNAPKEHYEKLEKIIDDEEEKRFGKGGFEKLLEIVVIIEKKLGIYDLKSKTPK